MTENRSRRFAVLSGLLVGALLLLGAAPARSQTVAASWLPWVGCWQPLNSPTGGNATGPMLCFRPAKGRIGVEMLAVQGDRIVSRRMVRADGRARRESQSGCSGTERAQFSSDGRRVFTSADLRCAGGATRRTTGIMSMIDPSEWLDVKSLEMGGRTTAWVERYELASRERTDAVGLGDIGGSRVMAIRSARMAAAAPIDVRDVIEASSIVNAAALKAWIAEVNHPFDLDAARLLRMKKAGVPGSVIDVMVAVTYPRKFALAGPRGVRPREAAPMSARRHGRYPRSGFMGCDPFFWDPYCFDSGYYGYGVVPYSYYGGYGFGYGGYYGGYTPVVINVRPATPASGYSHGRVVKGRGYVRGAPAGSGTPAGSVVPGQSRSPRSPATGGRSTGRKAHRRGSGGGGGGR